MPYTIFERKVKRLSNPTISIMKMGRLTLNKAAAAYLAEVGTTHVHLLWDAEARRFAIRPVFKKDDPRAYLVAFGADRPVGPDGKKRGPTVGASINCKTFLDHIGVSYKTTRAYPTRWNAQDNLLEIDLPEDAFQEEAATDSVQDLFPSEHPFRGALRDRRRTA